MTKGKKSSIIRMEGTVDFRRKTQFNSFQYFSDPEHQGAVSDLTLYLFSKLIREVLLLDP